MLKAMSRSVMYSLRCENGSVGVLEAPVISPAELQGGLQDCANMSRSTGRHFSMPLPLTSLIHFTYVSVNIYLQNPARWQAGEAALVLARGAERLWLVSLHKV